MAKYEVIVGNIGTVYSGSSEGTATERYEEYKQQSLSNRGRAGGEQVTLMCDGAITQEHTPDHSRTVTVQVTCIVRPTDDDYRISEAEALQVAKKRLASILEHAANGGFPDDDSEDLVELEFTTPEA